MTTSTEQVTIRKPATRKKPPAEQGLTKEMTAELSKNLPREWIQQLEGFDYIPWWRVAAEANRIFGFGGWTRETVDSYEVRRYVEEAGQKHHVVWFARVRVVAAGVVREGTGVGTAVSRRLSAAYDTAIKGAESDAFKRAMVSFGYRFGLALYDAEKEGVAPAAQPDASMFRWRYREPDLPPGWTREQMTRKMEDAGLVFYGAQWWSRQRHAKMEKYLVMADGKDVPPAAEPVMESPEAVVDETVTLCTEEQQHEILQLWISLGLSPQARSQDLRELFNCGTAAELTITRARWYHDALRKRMQNIQEGDVANG